VATKYRNVSLDALIEELNELKSQLEKVLTRSCAPVETELIKNIFNEVKLIANKITEQCTLK